MSMEKNLKEFLEELIQEVEKELDEATATGNVAGYNTPAAFSDGGRKDKKRKKKISTQFGMKIVGKMDEDSVNEAKVNYNFSEDELKRVLKLLGRNASTEIKMIKAFEKAFGRKLTRDELFESLNEAKIKRPVNRWLELKNDETMHPHKKMAMGLKELKYQLRETEKFFNWYNKIKTMNELDSNQYWKRTNTHIYKIKERLINIAKTIQEIEKWK